MNTEILALTKAFYLANPDAENKELEQFYLQNLPKIALLANDEEALIVSAIRIARRLSKEDIRNMFSDVKDTMLDNMELRGLIKSDEEGFCTTSCIQIASLYPLLGVDYSSGAKKRRADELSKIILCRIGSESIGVRELRSFFTYKGEEDTLLFPYLEQEEIEKAFLATLFSLIKLNVVEEGEHRLKVNFKLLKSFLDLDTISMYSYLIWPELEGQERKNSVRFLNLLLLCGTVKKDDLPSLIKRISILSSFPMDDPEPLFSFLLLAEDEEGNVYVRSGESGTEREIGISSDYSISVIGRTPSIIFLTSDAVQQDRIKIYRIDRKSIRTAFNLNMDADAVIDELKRYSNGLSSEMLFERIRSWYREYSRIRISRGMILMTDQRSANILSSLPSFMEHVIKDSGNGFFLMDENGEDEWRRILEKGGFEMLAEPSGPEFEKNKKEGRQFSNQQINPIIINEKRQIGFDRRIRETVLDETEEKDISKRSLKNLLIKSGMICNKQLLCRDLPFLERDAFDYQEKLRLIQYAYRNREFCLQVENHRGQSAIGRVEMVEDFSDGDHMVLGRKVLNISRLYKVRLVPAAYLTYPSRPNTDNDNRKTPQTGACPVQEASQHRNEDGSQPSEPV